MSKLEEKIERNLKPFHSSLPRHSHWIVETKDLDVEEHEIDERLAALDELDRKIRESVAQLRSVHSPKQDIQRPGSFIPFIDESTLNQSNHQDKEKTACRLPDVVSEPGDAE